VVERAAQLLSQAGDDRTRTRLYSDAGWAALCEDRPDEAIELLTVGMSAAEKLHTPAASKLHVLSNMGLAQLLVGNPRTARASFVEALEFCTCDAFRWGGAESLAGLAAVLAVEGQLEQSAQLLGAAEAAGYPGPDPDDQSMLDWLERNYFHAARARLGTAVWVEFAQAGADLSFDQAIAVAIAEAAHLDQSAQSLVEKIARLSSSSTDS
jgi:hypothetical protein